MSPKAMPIARVWIALAVVVLSWAIVRVLPPWAETLFRDDLAHANEDAWRAHRALRFDRHRAATHQWEQLAALLDHPDREVRNRAARIVASIDSPRAFDVLAGAWRSGRFEAKDLRPRLRRMDNPMILDHARAFVATTPNAASLELDDWLKDLEATDQQFFGDTRLREALAAYDAALGLESGS